MNPLVGPLVLILVALLGARLSFSAKRVPPGPRLLLKTGTHFLLIGFALGPVGLGLVTVEATEQLSPFLALGLGWVGFHFGLQLDRAALRRFPLQLHALAFGQAAIAFIIFYAGGWLALNAVGLTGDTSRLLLLGAASTASVTTPSGIAMVSANFLVKGKIRDLLFFVGSVDAWIGIVALQVTYSLYRPEVVAAGLPPTPQLALIAVALGLGLICGIVFVWLVRVRPPGEELVLFLLGMCAFSAGAALQWGLSPLFVSVTMGAVVANLGRSTSRILAVLQRWEKMIYVTFLLIAGALLQFPSWWVFPLAAGYAALRFAGKIAGGAVMATLLHFDYDVPRRVGLGLIPQGGISLAMAVSGVLVYTDLSVRGLDAEATLFSVIVIGVMLSELTGPFLTVKLLRRAGEISPRVEQALAEGDMSRARREAFRRDAPVQANETVDH
jgi:sodium/hydrogen exchanger family protein